MTLNDYARRTGVKDVALAGKIGCTRSYITQLRLGIRKQPSLNIALAIERATGGRVSVKAWGNA